MRAIRARFSPLDAETFTHMLGVRLSVLADINVCIDHTSGGLLGYAELISITSLIKQLSVVSFALREHPVVVLSRCSYLGADPIRTVIISHVVPKRSRQRPVHPLS